MRNQLSLTVRTKLSLLVTVLLQTVLFFALLSVPLANSEVMASYTRTNSISAPLDVAVVEIQPNSLLLSWNPPLLAGSQIDHYIIEYKQSSSNDWIVSGTTNSNTLSFVINGLTGQEDYHVRVAAVNASNEVGTYGYPWTLIYDVTEPKRTDTGLIQYESGFGIRSGDAFEVYSGIDFSRVRYRMEATYSGVDNYVDADFDREVISPLASGVTFSNLNNIQVPTTTGPLSQFIIQGNVSDLSVLASGIFNRNANSLAGRVEIWPFNYARDPNSELSYRVSDTYDDNDTPFDDHYGSFQLHELGDNAQTLFAWNRHNYDQTPEIGFGNYSGTHSDWTFSSSPGSLELNVPRSNFSLGIYVNLAVRISGFRIDAADSSTYSGIYDLNGGLAVSTQSGNSFFAFDGINDYIDTNLNFSNTSSFTITAWIRQDENATGNRAIVSDEPQGGASWEHRLMLSNKLLYSDIKSTSSTTAGLNSLSAGWNYVVTTLSDGRLKLYINGQEVRNVTHNGSPTQSQEIWIGASRISSEPPSYPSGYNFDGDISIVEYYSRGLSADEIYTKFFEEADRHFHPYSTYDSGIIRIDESKVDADLTNFPVTIVLNSGNFDFDLVQSSGADIFFTDTNNNLLPFEVDFVDVANESAVYHVLYSGVINSSDTDQDILIRYGSGAGRYYDFSKGYRPTEVWSNGYEFVSHLGTNLVDSTGQRTLINNGSTVTTTSGSLGESRRFNLSEVDAIEISGLLDLGSSHTILGRFQREYASDSQGSLNLFLVSDIGAGAWGEGSNNNFPLSSGTFTSKLRTLDGTVQSGVINIPNNYFTETFSMSSGTAQLVLGDFPASILTYNGINNVLDNAAGFTSITQDYYALELTGWFVPEITGTYRFDIDGDDAVDLIINNTLVSHYYGGHGANKVGAELEATSNAGPKVIGSIDLIAGIPYPIKIRMQEASGGDVLRLLWQRGEDELGGNEWYFRPQELYSSAPTRMDVVSSTNASGYALDVSETGYPVYIATEGDGWPTIYSNAPVLSGIFDTFTATNNPESEVNIYTSILVGSGTGLDPVTPVSNTVIGQDAYHFHSDLSAFAFNGWIDEIRLSSVERSAEWVKAEYYSIEGQLASPMYKVIFETNGGTSINSIVGEAGDSYSTPSTTRDGFRFMGWYSDAALTTSTTISNEIPVNGITYYAKWVPEYERYDSGIIRIDKTKVEDDLTNFPVTIVLNSGNFDFDLFQSSGADVFFTDTDHNLLLFEVDYVNVESGIAVYHVLYSGTIVNDSSNQDILIRYGDVENYFYDFSAGYNPTDVWSNGYLMVYHMGGSLIDSSANNYDLTAYSSGGATFSYIPSTLGRATVFDGSSNTIGNYYQLPTIPSSVSFASGITITHSSKWREFNAFSRIIDFGNANDSDNIHVSNHSTTSTYFFEVFSGSTRAIQLQSGLIDQNQFNQFTSVADGVNASTFKGTQLLFQSGNSFVPNSVTRSKNYIGRSNWAADEFFQGEIDELRIANVGRSQDWITAEVYSMRGELANPVYTVSFDSNGGSSVSDITGYVGSDITNVPTKSNYRFAGWFEDNNTFNSGITEIPSRDITVYAKWLPEYERYDSGIIRIDKTKVEDDLTNFPVTIVLNSGNFDFDLFQSSGADVFFTDTDHNLLPFEVDYVNVASGIAVYHVLYSGVITSGVENQDILIRYGDVENYFYDFSAGYNPTDVWDENYVLVMHMGSVIYDSTQTNTFSVNGTQTIQNNDIVGEARYFDGNDFINFSGLVSSDMSTPTTLVRFDWNTSDLTPSWDFIIEGSTMGDLMIALQNNLIVYSTDQRAIFNSNPLRLAGILDSSMFTMSLQNSNNIPSGLVYIDDTIYSGLSLQAGYTGGTFNPPNSTIYSIGRRYADNNSYFTGIIDELRLSKVERTSGWILAEHYGLSGQLANPVYTVTFDSNGGSIVSNITGFAGSGINPTTTKFGHLFEGWYSDSGLTQSISVTAIPNQDTTYYAKWSEDTRTGLIIDANNIDANLTDFPVTVVLDNNNFDFTGMVASGLYFSDGTNYLDFEIDFIDVANEKAVFHVLVPSVSSSSNTTFYIHQGREIDFSAGRNATNVWKSNYVFVSHMGTTVTDSKTPGRSITVGSNSTTTNSTLGKARVFDNDLNDSINIGDITINSNHTILVVLKPHTLPARQDYLSSHSGNGGYGFFFSNSSVSYSIGTGGGFINVYTTPLSANTSYVTTGTIGSNGQRTYLDGFLTNTNVNTTAQDTSTATFIGRHGSTTGKWYFDGEIDEVRIANTQRNDSWVKAEAISLQGNLVRVSGRPVITLNGNSVVSVNLGSGYSELGASAVDADGNNLAVTTTGSVNTAIPGNYIITYSATDANSLNTMSTRTVQVLDLISPSLTVEGDATIYVEVNGSFTDPGTSFTDNYSSGVTVTSSGTVDVTVAATYSLEYIATDFGGNIDSGLRTVIVYTPAAPVITAAASGVVTISGVQITATITEPNFNNTYPITKGVCYSTSMNPVVGGNCVSASAGAGNIDVTISGLSASTTYYLRVYATNSIGTTYSDNIIVTTNDPTLTFNTGVGTAINPVSQTAGSVYTYPSPTLFSYSFDGWYLDSNFSTPVGSSFPTEDRIVYAKWTEDSKTIIKIESSKIDATLSNFPLTVFLDESNFDLSNMNGIYFTDASNNLLDFEIDYRDTFNVGYKRAVYHVRIPTISHTSDTNVWIRVSPTIDYSGGNNPQDVWDDNYVFVTHFNSTLTDSTGNVPTNGSKFGTSIENSLVGKKHSFDGRNDYILFEQAGDLTTMANSSITVLALVYLDDTPSSTFRLIANNGGGWGRQGFYFAIDNAGIRNQMGTGSNETIWYAPDINPAGRSWQLAGIGYDTDTDKQVSYLNTSTVVRTTTYGGIYDYRSGADLNIGAGKVSDSLDQTATTNVAAERFFKGDMDEFRISNISRSAAWVKAEYFSLTDNLYVFSGQPVITVTGDLEVLIPLGATYVDSGATAVDGDGIIIPIGNIQSTNNINTSVTGTYAVEYEVTVNGDTVTARRTVIVRDITPPIISLSGLSTLTIPYSATPYTINDPGLEMSDNYDDSLSYVFLDNDGEPVTLESLVDVTTLGPTTVTYTVRDAAGNASTIQRTFEVVDEVSPQISLNGSGLIVVELGTNYVDSGVTYSDNYSVTAAISVTSGVTKNGLNTSINTSVVGDYIITYSATDENSNSSTVVRTVRVLDSISPVITRLGSASVRIPYGSSYTDSGVTVSDASGSITPVVVNPVNTNQVDTYTITYDAVDPSGNQAVQVTRTVEVYDDIAPTITGVSNQTINADVTSGFVAPVATFADNTGQLASSGIRFVRTSGMVELDDIAEVRQELFEMKQVRIEYTATDPSNNTRTHIITITPVDNIDPTFSGLDMINVTGAQIAGFNLPVPEIIDNDPLTTTYSVRAILGAANASDLTLLRPNQITALAAIRNCNTGCTSGENSPSSERYFNVFDQRANTKYLHFNKQNTGVEFRLDQARSIKQLVFRSANDASERDPMSFVLQGYNGSAWVNIATGNTNLTTSRYTNGSAVSISGAPSYQNYRIYFPTIRNNAANSMQIADILIYVDDTVFETNIANIRTTIQNRVPVTLEYTVTDAANNTTVVTTAVNLVNFRPQSNPDVTINQVEGTANQVFTFTYPENPMIDTDFDETLIYTTSGLPPGLSFDAATMTVSGTPTLVPGASIEDYTVTLIATDSQIDSGIRTHVIRIFYTADIDFVSNGGSAITRQSNIISQALPTEPIPARTGYAFEGWYTNIGLTNAFDWSGVMPDTNQTLYAKWSVVNYPIQYVFNVGNTALKGSYTIEDETYIFPPAGSAGRTFMGWFYDSAFTQEATQITAGSTGGVTVYAKWETLEYTLSFRADGRTVESVTVPFGAAVPGLNPAVPEKKGHTAVGWDAVPPATMPARSVRINAIYQINQYTATYEDDEGNVLGSETVDYGSALSLPTPPEKEGYTFKGWSSAASTMPDADITIKAEYEALSFTVTFVDDQGTTLGTAEVEFDSTVTPITPPEREGFTFKEWQNLPSTMPAEAVTVTAVYDEVVEEEEETPEEPDVDEPTTEVTQPTIPGGGTITVRPVIPNQPTETPNEEETEETPSEVPVVYPPVRTKVTLDGREVEITFTPGEPVGNLPEPTLEGYVFKGWMNAIDGQEITPETVITNPTQVVLIPTFEKAPNLLDAARRVFEPRTEVTTTSVTNDNTARTDNISSTNQYGIDILDTIETENGLTIEVRADGTAMIVLENERMPITFNAIGFDIPSTVLYYMISDQPEDFESDNWKVYVGEPFFTDEPGASVFFMIKDANNRNEVQYYKPATFISNAVNIPIDNQVVRVVDNNRNLVDNPEVKTIEMASVTSLEYDGDMLDFFTIRANTENLDRVEISYRTDEEDSFVLQLEAATWKTVFLQPGQIANILLREGSNVDFITNYVFADGSEIRDTFMVENTGTIINIVLYNDPNPILLGVFYMMLTGYLGYVLYPYVDTYRLQKENPLVS